MKNYYEILGLRQNATDEEIKTAYRKLSLKFHPDKNEGDKYFEEWAKKINEAYETLGNKGKKSIYDEGLRTRCPEENNSSSSNSSSKNHSSTNEYEVLNKLRKLTPEFLNAKSSLAEAQYNYNNISHRSVSNKFTTTRILFIILLSVISAFGLKKKLFTESVTDVNTETQNNGGRNAITTKKTIDIVGEPIYDVGNSILFTTFNGLTDSNEILAVPVALFINGQYQTPPTCEIGGNEAKAKSECQRAQEILLPSVNSGATLYLLDNGKQSKSITVLNTKQFGFSDWQTYSALIEEKPKTSILTDNPKIGTNKLYIIKDKPMLKVRKDPEGNVLSDRLLTKVDIDGDGMPELIYECSDYEGTFYQIYSNKNGKWTNVYEGGYQGL